MEGQGQLFDPSKINTSQFSTHEQRSPFQSAASRYMQGKGLGEYTPVPADRQDNPRRSLATAKAYQEAQDAPESPTIRKSYEAMRQAVNDQYEFMTKPEDQGGMGISVSVHDKDPYDFGWSGGDDKSSRKALEEDVQKNKHLKILGTKATGGHAYFSDEENDRFRAVHDVFGHTAVGGSFSRHGEEGAYESHKQMFPPEAHEALTSETRGQNTYLNYGPGTFPDQSKKLIGLPKWAEGSGEPVGFDRPAAAKNTSRSAKRAQQLRMFR